jgi:hypothetical protein
MFTSSFRLVVVSLIFLASSCSTSPKKALSETSSQPNARELKVQAKTEKNDPSEIFDTEQIHFNHDPKVWKKIGDSEGIQTYEKIDTSDSVVAFRGEALIPEYLTKIATVLNQPELRKDWVDSLAESRSIEKFNDFDRVEYNRTTAPWPLQDRDFVYRVKVRIDRTAPTMLIDMKSTTHLAAPEKPGVVRGDLLYSFTYLKQVPGVRATRVVVEMAVDPKGAIPKWMVNLSQKRWPYNTLLALKKISQREDLVVSKEIEEYFKESPRRRRRR